MATTTTNPFAASSPLTPMHPTMTEHDFRFPRRPGDAATAARKSHHRLDQAYTPAPAPGTSPAAANALRSATMAAGPGRLRPGLQDFRLDPQLTPGGAHHDMLRASAFPPFQQGASRETQNLEEMQRQDPLATQIWRFYARTKQLLPAQERMENLTWRMMHLKLLQTKAATKAVKYVVSRGGFVVRLVRVCDSGRVWRENVLTWPANEEAAVSQTQRRRMPRAGLRNCASPQSMPRCSQTL